MDIEYCQMFFWINCNYHMIVVFHFVKVVCHFNQLMDVKPSFHTWNKSHLTVCMIVLIYWWIWFVNIFSRIFASFSSWILACNLPFVWYLCLLLVSGQCWSCKMSFKAFLFLHFCENNLRRTCKLSCKYLIEFTWGTIWPRTFICCKFLNYWFNFITSNRWGTSGNSGWLYFFWVPKSLQMVIAAMKLKDTCSFKEKLRQT